VTLPEPQTGTAKTFELREEHMPAPSLNKAITDSPSSRLSELGIVLPAPPTPLGACVEASDTGNLLFLSGTLPDVNRKLAYSGRLGKDLSAKDGQEAVRIAGLNALAAARQHLGDLDRLKKLVKLTVLMSTTEQSTEQRRAGNEYYSHQRRDGDLFQGLG
jgi:enamine deaminase RidA (YjgF/YER057c/UK114 family)